MIMSKKLSTWKKSRSYFFTHYLILSKFIFLQNNVQHDKESLWYPYVKWSGMHQTCKNQDITCMLIYINACISFMSSPYHVHVIDPFLWFFTYFTSNSDMGGINYMPCPYIIYRNFKISLEVTAPTPCCYSSFPHAYDMHTG